MLKLNKVDLKKPPLDLIGSGIHRGTRGEREHVEIASIAFVYKCEQTRATWDTSVKGPLPPS